MARAQQVTMLIYEEEMKFIQESTLKYPDIETGGDVFGLWRNENEVVVTLVTGPGRNCRRTTTAFFQDQHYLSSVGNYLTSAKGLCNIGEWHSHHSLNLPEPSYGDKSTVWRNMPGSGLKRFLLIIATIKRDMRAQMNGFMFTAPANGSRQGEMFQAHFKRLPGSSPYRKQPDVEAKMNEGAETFQRNSDQDEQTSHDSPIFDDRVTCLGSKGRKKEKKQQKEQKKREKKEQKKLNGKRKKGGFKPKPWEYSPLATNQNTNTPSAGSYKSRDTTPPQRDNRGEPGSFFQDNPSGSITDLAGHESSSHYTSSVAMCNGSYVETAHYDTGGRGNEQGNKRESQPNYPAGPRGHSLYSRTTTV